MEFKHIETKKIYDGKVIKLEHKYMETPNGKVVPYEVLRHNGAAAIIPIDKDGNILMVRQYRVAINKNFLEIPAGKLEENEDPYECATRELEEETGYISKNIEFLMSFYTAIGYCDEKIYVYVAKDLELTQQHLDDDEYVEIERYSLNQLMEMIMNGEIDDSKTINSILAYKYKYGI